jgi:5'-deoxynucleotidase YfbR-like HD superfamily hydrolase
MIDLLDPRPDQIDFRVIAEHLAKDNRYCGATKGFVYSVAEHSARCAEAAYDATGDSTLAAYLLCHDMHEAFLGDDTTPKKQALAGLATQRFGVSASTSCKPSTCSPTRFDVVIHDAAGLTWPPRTELQAAVKRWDRILLATEWRDLMRCDPPYDFHATPLAETIVPMPWQDAQALLNQRMHLTLPCFTQEAL